MFCKTIALSLLAGVAFAQTQIDWLTQVKNKNGYVANQSGTNGGYFDFPPITYNPYDAGSPCFDKWLNKIQQPLPANGQAAFGPNDLLLWNGTSPSMQFNPGVTGLVPGLVQSVVITDVPSTQPGPCGIPLPVNQLYGINTNGYFFGRAGLATDAPKYNSIQSLQGGITANSITMGVLYPIGTTTTTGTLSAVTYLGGHADTGHSIGPPATARITSSVSAGGSSFAVNYGYGLAAGVTITFEDATPEVITVAGSYASGSLTVPIVGTLASNHTIGTPVAWAGGSIAAVTNPFSGGEGLVAGQLYYDDGLHCEQVYSGTAWACLGGGGGGSVGSPGQIQYSGGGGAFAASGNFTYNAGTNILTITGSAGQGVSAPVYSAYAGSGNVEFQGSNVTLAGNGNIGTNGWLTLKERSATGVTTGATLDVLYGDSGTHQLMLSLNGGAFAPIGSGGGGSVGAAGQIQYSGGSGAFAASGNFTYNAGTNILTITGSAGQGVSAPVYSAYAGPTNVEFQGSNVTLNGNGNIATNGFLTLKERSSVGVTTGATLDVLYGDSSTHQLMLSLNGGGFVAVGGGGGAPGGPANAVQFNSSGFAGSGNYTWNNASQLLTVLGIANTAAISVGPGFIQSDGGFVVTGTTAYNSIHTAATGGVAGRSFTASAYVQTGNSSGAPAPTTSDAFHAGALYYDIFAGCEEVYNGASWTCLAAGASGVSSFNSRTGAVTLTKADVTGVTQALGTSDSPTFAGATFTSNYTATTATFSSTLTQNGINGTGGISGGSFAISGSTIITTGQDMNILGHSNVGTVYQVNGTPGVTKTCTVLPTVIGGIITAC